MRIAVIGAGIAGLVAAYTLANKESVVIYEKSRGLGGRAATRWHDLPDGQRVYIDHGAQYIKDESPIMHEFLHEILPMDDLVDIARPVWTFDAANRISEGDAAQNTTPKWTYRQGLSALGKLIVQAGDLEVRSSVRVSHLRYFEHQYQLIDEHGATLGTYEQVLIAIPAGQAAEMIQKSDLPPIERISLVGALQRAQYRRCITVALGYHRQIQKRPYYALVDTSKKNPLSWLAFEHDKPGHVPAGHSVIVAQMAGGYSLERWDTDQPIVISEVAKQVSSLLGEDLTNPDWTEYQKWRYSLPDRTLSEIEPNICMRGLWFAGDWSPGGRVHLAAQVGHEVAARMVLQVDV